MTVNLTERNLHGEWAIYLPALSTFYLRQIGKLNNDPNYHGADRLGPTFDKGHDGLNFLQPNAYYHYKWALYSAGHAHLDLDKGRRDENMVHGRDRNNTIIVGDSSGFQVAKGTSHFKNVDWSDFAGPSGDVIRGKILNWLEETADWSMTFDIPALSAEPPFNQNTGLTTFQETLDLSIINLEYFLKNRTPGKTKFLNVLSGSTPQNSRTWYDAVIPYSMPNVVTEMGYTPEHALEGYAFAGINRMNMKVALTRIVDLKNDGLLEGKDWIHFLGIGRLDWACYLTAVQRMIRKHYNPNIVISFDAASPFVAVAKGLTYSHNVFSPKRWGYNMEAAIDERSMKGSTKAFPFQSPIADRMNIGHICRLGPGEANRQGKVANTSWDNMSYLLLMSHCVYNHIAAVQEANRLTDYEMVRYHVDWREWRKERRSSMANEISAFVPATLLYFNSFIEELLDPACKDPYALIDEATSFLEAISFGGKDSTTFKDLFDDAEPTPEEDFVSLDDDDLVELEEAVD